MVSIVWVAKDWIPTHALLLFVVLFYIIVPREKLQRVTGFRDPWSKPVRYSTGRVYVGRSKMQLMVVVRDADIPVWINHLDATHFCSPTCWQRSDLRRKYRHIYVMDDLLCGHHRHRQHIYLGCVLPVYADDDDAWNHRHRYRNKTNIFGYEGMICCRSWILRIPRTKWWSIKTDGTHCLNLTISS